MKFVTIILFLCMAYSAAEEADDEVLIDQMSEYSTAIQFKIQRAFENVLLGLNGFIEARNNNIDKSISVFKKELYISKSKAVIFSLTYLNLG